MSPRALVVRCGCGNAIPIRLADQTEALLRSYPPETVILTYRCRGCGIVAVTVAHLAPPQRKAA